MIMTHPVTQKPVDEPPLRRPPSRRPPVRRPPVRRPPIRKFPVEPNEPLPTVSSAAATKPSPITSTIAPIVEEVKTRVKRWLGIATLVTGMIFKGVQTYLNHKRENAMERGITALKTDMDLQKEKIKSLGETMTTVAKVQFKKIKHIFQRLKGVSGKLEALTTRVNKLQTEWDILWTRSQDQQNAISFLTIAIGGFHGKSMKLLTIYNQLITETYHLMDGLETMATGRLSHSIIPPATLKEMLEHVELDVQENYKEYELALRMTHQYYNMPRITYCVVGEVLVIQMPIFIKHYTTVPLELYKVTTVAVPLHSHMTYPEAAGRQPYTLVKADHELLAMSNNQYMSLDMNDLIDCTQLGDTRYCENLHLVTHRTEHTCESAIFWNESVSVIDEKCEVQYSHEYLPEPKILDAGEWILLVGLPGPWSIVCSSEQQMPIPIQAGPYIIIKRKHLCLCAISAGPYFLQETISSCKEDPDLEVGKGEEFTYYYTINTAVLYGYGTNIPNVRVIKRFVDPHRQDYFMQMQIGERMVDVTDKMLFEEPMDMQVQEPQVESGTDQEDVLEVEYDDQFEIELDEVVEAVEEGRTVYLSKEDQEDKYQHISSWYTGDTPGMAFVFIASIAGMLSFVLLIIAYNRLCFMQYGMSKLTTHMSKYGQFLKRQKAAQAGIALGILGESQAQTVSEALIETECSLDHYITWSNVGKVLAFQISLMVIMWVIVTGLRKLCVYLDRDYYSSPFQFCKTLFGMKGEPGEMMDVFLEFSSGSYGEVLRAYLTSMIGFPSMMVKKGHFHAKDLEYEVGWFHDTLRIDWEHVNLWHQNELMYLPATCTLPFWGRYKFRKMLKHMDAKSRILLMQGNRYYVLDAGDQTYLLDEKNRLIQKISDNPPSAYEMKEMTTAPESVLEPRPEFSGSSRYTTDMTEVNLGSEIEEEAIEEIRFKSPKHEACYIYKGIPKTVICPKCDTKLYI